MQLPQQLTPIEKIRKAKIKLLSNNPFFGYLVLNLNIKEDNNMPMPTACVDAFGNMFFDSNFINKLDMDETTTLVCFTENVMIGGEEFKPIKKIKIGDLVINKDGHLDNVKKIFKRRFDGEILTLYSRNMLSLDVTMEHPLLVCRKIENPNTKRENRGFKVQYDLKNKIWIKAKDLKNEDLILIPKIKGYFCDDVISLKKYKKYHNNKIKLENFPINKETAYFLGLYVSEGSTLCENTVNLDFNSKEKYITKILQKIIMDNFSLKLVMKIKKNELNIRTNNTILCRFLKDVCGDGSHTKKIPSFILYNKNIEILKSFLEGYEFGDGFYYAKRKRQQVATVSRVLAYQLQMAYARLGILANVYLYHRDKGYHKIRNHILPELNIYQLCYQHIKKNNVYADDEEYIYTKIRDIKKRNFSGYVYNLETKSHTYTANNIIVHNCHETAHIMLQHLSRLKGREMDIWNIAIDICVNNLLQKNGFKMIEGTIIPENDEYSVPMTNIHITNISKKSAEQIYEELTPLVKQKQALKDLLKKIIDGHKFSKDEEKQLTPQEKEIIKRWKDLLVEATEIARQKGNVPAGIDRYVKTLLEQKLDWKSLLYKYIVREIPHNFAYTRPSKKTISAGYFVPSVVRENINIVASIDTSGSIRQEELQEFLSEITGIAKAFDNIKIKLIICDCRINAVYDVENGSIEEIMDLKMKGGGGTSHKPIFHLIENELQNTKLLVALTDGYSDIHSIPEPNFNVIWVISKNGVNQPFQFGETIFLED